MTPSLRRNNNRGNWQFSHYCNLGRPKTVVRKVCPVNMHVYTGVLIDMAARFAVVAVFVVLGSELYVMVVLSMQLQSLRICYAILVFYVLLF